MTRPHLAAVSALARNMIQDGFTGHRFWDGFCDTWMPRKRRREDSPQGCVTNDPLWGRLSCLR
jgi:hypothetical protein